jgi:hypothetical protein
MSVVATASKSENLPAVQDAHPATSLVAASIIPYLPRGQPTHSSLRFRLSSKSVKFLAWYPVGHSEQLSGVSMTSVNFPAVQFTQSVVFVFLYCPGRHASHNVAPRIVALGHLKHASPNPSISLYVSIAQSKQSSTLFFSVPVLCFPAGHFLHSS